MEEGIINTCHGEDEHGKTAVPALFRYFRVLFADCLPVLLNDFYVRNLVMVGDGLALVTAIPGSYSNPQEPNLLRSNSPTRFCNQKDAEKEHLSNYYFRIF